MFHGWLEREIFTRKTEWDCRVLNSTLEWSRGTAQIRRLCSIEMLYKKHINSSYQLHRRTGRTNPLLILLWQLLLWMDFLLERKNCEKNYSTNCHVTSIINPSQTVCTTQYKNCSTCYNPVFIARMPAVCNCHEIDLCIYFFQL